MTCVGELECYVRATSEEEARKMLIATYGKLGEGSSIVIEFPDVGDDAETIVEYVDGSLKPLGDLWTEDDQMRFDRDNLQAEYKQWLKENVPSDMQDWCADDVMSTINADRGFCVTIDQYAWLENFCKRCDKVSAWDVADKAVDKITNKEGDAQ